MTALPPPPLRLSRAQRKLGLQLMDYMTVRPYPLDMSGWSGPASDAWWSGCWARSVDSASTSATYFRSITALLNGSYPRAPSHEGDAPRARPPAGSDPPFRPGSLGRRPAVHPIRGGHLRARRRRPATPRLDRAAAGLSPHARDSGPDHRSARGLPAADGFRPAATARTAEAARRVPPVGDAHRGRPDPDTDANRALDELAIQVRADPPVRAAFSELDAPTC